MKGKIKAETKILIMLAFYSISVGLWGNFRELWLQDNKMDVSTISNLLSIGTFLSAILILISSKTVKLNKIKSLITYSLFIKSINMVALFFINGTNLSVLFNCLIIIDIMLEKLIITSIYPLIVTIKKDDRLYSKRKLVEYLFRDIGILIGGLFIGKTIFSLNINYNACLMISLIFAIIAYIILANIKLKTKEQKSEASLKVIFKDKIARLYVICYFISQVAMKTGLGILMLMLTNQLNFTPSGATNYMLIVGLASDIIGILALRYFTPKNDYITMAIKFGIRFLGYVLAFISNSFIMILVAITWSKLISTAYENKTDGVYINRIPTKYQLFFTDIRYVVGMLGESVGLLFAGITFEMGIRYTLGLSALFMIIQISMVYILIYMRRREEK